MSSSGSTDVAMLVAMLVAILASCLPLDDCYVPLMSLTPRLDDVVTSLVPSLSRSLAEHFNVFRVMHHGTHEKQLSNVFAWLLRTDATHELGDRFQRLFLAQVNENLPAEFQLPADGYQVTQEVNTVAHGETGMDIADIVLSRRDACLVIENFGTSDGHGHEYRRYLSYASTGGRRAVVVLLCLSHQPHLQRDGWQDAVVTTYGSLLRDLQQSVTGDRAWHRTHPHQAFFLDQLFHHFLEGPSAMSLDDRLTFLKTMCEPGSRRAMGTDRRTLPRRSSPI